MPEKALVTVRYGPYDSCGIVDHRTFRLEGLLAVLHGYGHRCSLEKTQDWNKVELVVNGEIVYECNIKDLEYGGDGRLDQLCDAAATAVKQAY